MVRDQLHGSDSRPPGQRTLQHRSSSCLSSGWGQSWREAKGRGTKLPRPVTEKARLVSEYLEQKSPMSDV